MVSRPHKKGNLKGIFSVLRGIFGLVILFALVYYVSVNNVFEAIKSINVYLLPIIISLYVLFLVISTICVKTLLKQNIRFQKLFKYYSLSWVFGLLLPGKIGEFSLAFFLKREGLRLIPSFVIFFLDKFITFIFLTLVTFFGVFFFFDFRQSVYFILSTSFIIFLVFSFLNIKVFWVLIPKKYRSHSEEFVKEYNLFFKENRKKIYLNFIFTSFKWIVNSLAIFLVFLSLGVMPNILYVLVINTITAMASLIPITINGLGIRQSLGVYLFSKIGVEPTLSLSMYLISLSITYLLAFCLYSYYSYLDGSRVSQ